MGTVPIGTLVLQRPKHTGRDMFRSYKVAVGRDRAVKLKNGATLPMELPAGPYLLQATISWCKSAIIRVEIIENEAITVTCSPNLAYRGTPTPGSQFAANYIQLTVESP